MSFLLVYVGLVTGMLVYMGLVGDHDAACAAGRCYFMGLGVFVCWLLFGRDRR